MTARIAAAIAAVVVLATHVDFQEPHAWKH
jgi:hypothetical protein